MVPTLGTPIEGAFSVGRMAPSRVSAALEPGETVVGSCPSTDFALLDLADVSPVFVAGFPGSRGFSAGDVAGTGDMEVIRGVGGLVGGLELAALPEDAPSSSFFPMLAAGFFPVFAVPGLTSADAPAVLGVALDATGFENGELADCLLASVFCANAAVEPASRAAPASKTANAR